MDVDILWRRGHPFAKKYASVQVSFSLYIMKNIFLYTLDTLEVKKYLYTLGTQYTSPQIFENFSNISFIQINANHFIGFLVSTMEFIDSGTSDTA